MQSSAKWKTTLFWVVVLGSLWGIFEATVGYVLHQLPISIGWLVWYPVACFFMGQTYRKTDKVHTIMWVGCLSALIKLLDLLLPVRIDRVINPAVSILLESCILFIAVLVMRKLPKDAWNKFYTKTIFALCINTGWRLLYLLYIVLLTPQWMQEISVLRSDESLVKFLVLDNLGSSMVIFLGLQLYAVFTPAVIKIRGWLHALIHRIPLRLRLNTAAKIIIAILLLCADIMLQFTL